MAKPENTGLLRAVRAMRYSAQGLKDAWIHESAFRQELVLTVILAPIALWIGRSAIEKAMLIGVCLLVLIVELLNSAIEAAVDRHGSERHELSGRAKDIASAAVFMALLLAGLVWGSVLWEQYFR